MLAARSRTGQRLFDERMARAVRQPACPRRGGPRPRRCVRPSRGRRGREPPARSRATSCQGAGACAVPGSCSRSDACFPRSVTKLTGRVPARMVNISRQACKKPRAIPRTSVPVIAGSALLPVPKRIVARGSVLTKSDLSPIPYQPNDRCGVPEKPAEEPEDGSIRTTLPSLPKASLGQGRISPRCGRVSSGMVEL